MTGVIGHAGETLDHRRDPRQSPQIRRKPMRAGSFAERVTDARQLGRRQFRFPPCPPGSVQRGGAPTSPRLIPAAHTLPAHLQDTSDMSQDLARRKQARRPSAAQFQGVKISSLRHMDVHAPSITERAGGCHSILRDSIGY